ncbi:MAG: hypothetical protein PF904_04860 [Kiritimatiellae bacterium]|jgi:hypothetical protein|nr:hypothetical protein [Kiritimatiellia bacterium]
MNKEQITQILKQKLVWKSNVNNEFCRYFLFLGLMTPTPVPWKSPVVERQGHMQDGSRQAADEVQRKIHRSS